MNPAVAHIGIAVPSITEALRFYRGVLGPSPGPGGGGGGAEAVDGAKIVRLHFGDVDVELLEPNDPASPVAKFLANGDRASITSATACLISTPHWRVAARPATSSWMRRPDAGPADGESLFCIRKQPTAFCWRKLSR